MSAHYVSAVTSNLFSLNGEDWTRHLSPKTVVTGFGPTSPACAIHEAVRTALTGALPPAFPGNTRAFVRFGVVGQPEPLPGGAPTALFSPDANWCSDVRAFFPMSVGRLVASLDPAEAFAGLITAAELLSGRTQIDTTELIRAVPASLRDEWGEEVTRLQREVASDAALPAMRAFATRRADALDSEAGVLDKTARRIEERALAQQRVAGARRPGESERNPHRTPEAVRAEIEEAEALLEQWRTAEQAALEQIAHLATSADGAGSAAPVDALRDLLSAHVQTPDREKCPVCMAPVGSAFLMSTRDWADGLATAQAARVQAGGALRARIESQAQEAATMVTEWEGRLGPLRAELHALELEARASVLAAASLRDQPGPAEVSRAADQEAEKKHADARAYRDVAALCGRMLSQRAQRDAEIVTMTVNGVLCRDAHGFQAALSVDVDKGHCTVGVVQSAGRMRAVLDAPERLAIACAVAEALGRAVAKRANPIDNAPVVVFDPDLRGWPMKSVASAMKRWSDFPGQVLVLASDRPPRLAGWTAVATDEATPPREVARRGKKRRTKAA